MALVTTLMVALQAILNFSLKISKAQLNADFHSREKMHNASTIALVAFANAFLGISLTQWPIRLVRNYTQSGRTNAILLSYVIPVTTTRLPIRQQRGKSTNYTVQMKYQDIARMFGDFQLLLQKKGLNLTKAVSTNSERIGIQMNFLETRELKKKNGKLILVLSFLWLIVQCSPANPRLPMVDHMQE